MLDVCVYVCVFRKKARRIMREYEKEKEREISAMKSQTRNMSEGNVISGRNISRV